MPLRMDPEVELAIRRVAGVFRHVEKPPLGDVALRRAYAADFARLTAGVPGPPNVRTKELETLGRDGTRVGLRFYERVDGVRGPAVLYIHGGGMILGSIDESHTLIAGYVAASGVSMLAVDYRLAPEHPHPAPVEDCYAALCFLVQHGGVDPTRIGVMGDSAGGGLAAATTLVVRDRGGPAIARQVLVYPMVDDRTTSVAPALAPFLTWSLEDNETGWRALLGERFGGDVPEHAAPARARKLSGLPPAYIEVGQLDLFCDEDIAYAGQLARAGVEVELHVHPGCPHSFDRYAPRAAVTKRAMADRLRVLASL